MYKYFSLKKFSIGIIFFLNKVLSYSSGVMRTMTCHKSEKSANTRLIEKS